MTDQLELLLCLLEDSEARVVQLAEETLNAVHAEPLAGWLAGEDATTELRETLALRGIAPAARLPRASASPLPDSEDGPDRTHQTRTLRRRACRSCRCFPSSNGPSWPCVAVGSSGPCSFGPRTRSCRLRESGVPS